MAEEKTEVKQVKFTGSVSVLKDEDVDKLIDKIKSKVPNVHVYNTVLIAKIQIPAGAKGLIQPTLTIWLGTNNIENLQLYLPGKHIYILRDAYANDVKIDGAFMFFRNGVRLDETIPSIAKPKFAPLVYRPLEVISPAFIPFDKVDKDVTQTVVFDVVVIDFTDTAKAWTDIESVLENAIEEIRKEQGEVEDIVMKELLETQQAIEKLKAMMEEKKE